MVQLKKGRAGLLGSMGSHRYGAAVLMARKSEFWCLAQAQAPVQPSAPLLANAPKKWAQRGLWALGTGGAGGYRMSSGSC
jgi:hypothetical protein